MNVLVIGSGGREHALCSALYNSPTLNNLYVIPGNPGMMDIATCVTIDPLNNELIKEFALSNNIKLIIPGSEVYLENGINDYFNDTDIVVFGPNKKAARIESSKEFAKDIMKKYNIPTASYQTFTDYQKAVNFVLEKGVPIVIKYDGLAGGKGVVVAFTFEEAKDALTAMLKDKIYGNNAVIIEDFLEGPEFSLMCFVHHDMIIKMPIAQDHKRLLNHDLGPNTGGMGIYCDVPIISNEVITGAMNSIMKPTIEALVKEGCPFTGFLYGGLMLTKEGPKVIEFNARFGDPEAEVILPKLQSDLIKIITDITNFKQTNIVWSEEYYAGVVLASKGYPLAYEKGFVINGLEDIDSPVFHMGTKLQDNTLVTNGGRVLLVTGKGTTLRKAVDHAYSNVQKISCDNLIYRTDIGNKSL